MTRRRLAALALFLALLLGLYGQERQIVKLKQQVIDLQNQIDDINGPEFDTPELSEHQCS